MTKVNPSKEITEKEYDAFSDDFIALVENHGFAFGGGTGHHTEEELGKIQKEEDSKLKDSKFMRHLEAVGVDNWEGYGIAQERASKE